MNTGLLISASAILVSISAVCSSAPTVYQNRDEPGRSPYSEFQQDTAGTFNTNLIFAKVPNRKRRVITHANCSVAVPPSTVVGGIVLVRVDRVGSQVESEYLPFAETFPKLPSAQQAEFATSDTPQMYIGPGEYPLIVVRGSWSAASSQCRLSGYDVSFP